MLKNSFKLKHIALGLMIAGVSVGTTFAAEYTAVSQSISGNAPILKSTLPNAADNTLHYRVVDSGGAVLSGRSIKVGDKIQILYLLADADGDKESDAVHSAQTAKFFFSKEQQGTNNWVQITTGVDTSKKGIATVTVNASMLGAKRIGFTIQAKTEYGAPNEGDWLVMGNIFDKKNGPNVTPEEPVNPGGGGGGTGDGGGEGGDNINPDNPVPVPEKGLDSAIFAVNDNGSIDYSTNYHKDSNKSPRVGGKYIAAVYVVTSDDPLKQVYDATTVAEHRGKWTYTLKAGTDKEVIKAAGIMNTSYEIAVPASHIVDGVVAIKPNSEYPVELTDGTASHAGAQGFILKAVANID